MYPVYFIRKNEQSETTLRNSAVRYSKFCGSLFGLVKFHMRGINLRIFFTAFLAMHHGCILSTEAQPHSVVPRTQMLSSPQAVLMMTAPSFIAAN